MWEDVLAVQKLPMTILKFSPLDFPRCPNPLTPVRRGVPLNTGVSPRPFCECTCAADPPHTALRRGLIKADICFFISLVFKAL